MLFVRRFLPIGRVVAVLALAMFAALVADVALACPTCKDQLAHDPESANVARGYAMSIIFMLSMPPLIFTGLGSYFYWEVRRARANMSSSRSRETSDAATAGGPKSHDFGCGYPAT